MALALVKRTGPSPYVSKLREQLATANEARKAAMAKARGNVAGKGGTLIAAGTVASGGVVAAAARKYVGEELMGVDTRLVVGGGMIAAGAFGVGSGKIATGLILSGGGVLACAVEDLVEDMLPELGGDAEGEE